MTTQAIHQQGITRRPHSGCIRGSRDCL